MRSRHGMTHTSEYQSWEHMIQRTTNKDSAEYARYGDRVKYVCHLWLDFSTFFADMGLKPSVKHQLDRKDNRLGYFKGNCRWATSLENNWNTSKSKWWFVDGVKYESSGDAATKLSVSSATIVRWCNGYVACGVEYSRKDGCYSVKKYP